MFLLWPLTATSQVLRRHIIGCTCSGYLADFLERGKENLDFRPRFSSGYDELGSCSINRLDIYKKIKLLISHDSRSRTSMQERLSHSPSIPSHLTYSPSSSSSSSSSSMFKWTLTSLSLSSPSSSAAGSGSGNVAGVGLLNS